MIKKYTVTVNGKKYEVEVEAEGTAASQNTESAPVQKAAPAAETAKPAAREAANTAASKKINSPMPGTVLRVNVKLGSEVKAGDSLLVLESMKMENEITAPEDGKITAILAQEGVRVKTGDALIAYN